MIGLEYRSVTVIATTVAFLLSACSAPTRVARSRLRPQPQRTYTCGDSGGNHCYARTYWTAGSYGYFAANVLVVNLQAESDQFIDDELWLVDRTCNKPDSCWIEAGLMADRTGSVTGPQYFWAQGLPNGDLPVRYFGVANSSTFSKYMRVELSGAGGKFDVHITPPGATAGYDSKPLSIAMRPSLIQLGQELSGTQGSFAPKAMFTKIRAGSTAPGAAVASEGNILVHSPPFGGWIVKPGGPREAIFATQCC